MTDIFECDKCGGIYPSGSFYYWIQNFPPTTYRDMLQGHFVDDPLTKYELCRGCSKLLDRWLHPKKTNKMLEFTDAFVSKLVEDWKKKR